MAPRTRTGDSFDTADRCGGMTSPCRRRGRTASKRWLALLLLVTVSACGGGSDSGAPGIPTAPTAPTAPAPPPPPPPPPPAPSPPPTPAPQTKYTLSGSITEAGTSTAATDARVQVLDGPNQGRSVAADGEGRYRIDDLEAGTFGVRATANGFEPETRTVTLTANQVADFGLQREARRPGGSLTGRVTDGVTDRALSGITIRIDGVGEAVSAGDGAFAFTTAEPTGQVRPVMLTSAATIERQTHLRVPGPPTTLTLMPVSADLAAFDQMFRNGGVLRRWTAPPPIVIQRRTLRFTGLSDTEFTATATTMSDADVAGLIADLTWALPQLTGNAFANFSDVRAETADEGARVPVTRVGSIVIARYEGLSAETTFWGYTRWAWNGAGEIQAATLMLDHGFDASASRFRRSLRAHELGHALGYAHVSTRDSVMNASGQVEPNDFDRNGAKLAFRRPPLNRSPDIDPDPFVNNLRAPGAIVWHPGMR